jgi:hypothetical protein
MKELNSHIDLCPCGSGRVIKECCLTKRNETTPPGAKTGYSNSRCYARAISDCDRNLSREHYISESILHLRDKSISITGFPWLNSGEQRSISKTSLTAKVLCSRHNSVLSGLDSTALLLFTYLMGLNIEENQEVLLVNGEEIERWMLKVLCGIAASGNVVRNTNRLLGWEPPYNWLEILFGSGRIPLDCGLYYIIGKYHLPANQFTQITPIFNKTSGDIEGMTFVLEGFPFLFAMEPPSERDRHMISGAELRYHPERLQIRTSEDVREVHFGWKEGRFIVMELTND